MQQSNVFSQNAGQDQRIPLLQGQKIELSQSIGGARQVYEILGEVGRGGSAICYNAVRTLPGGVPESGKLKEFYPLENPHTAPYYNLTRAADGQLVPGLGTCPDWAQFCREYLAVQNSLKALLAQEPDHEVLKNYLQGSEILYGCSSAPDRAATCYIWSRGQKGLGLDAFLDSIRTCPPRDPVQNLVFLLQVLANLSDCISALHCAGYLHLDLKPENILLLENSSGEATAQISLFDYNSFYSLENASGWRCLGTPGYSAPEVREENGRVLSQADLYSIGCIFYHAVILLPDDAEGLYADSFYEKLPQLVGQSLLLRSVPAQAKNTVRRILQKCLDPCPARRYEGAGQLSQVFASLSNALQRESVRRDLVCPERVRTDPKMILQSFLYRHPLQRQSGKMNVLVLGSSEYTRYFIDQILQAGQMPGTELSILAYSNFAQQAREEYLRHRPALGEFVRIDGCFANQRYAPYADLHFLDFPDGQPETSDRVQAFCDSALAENSFAMMLVDLGSERLNALVAKTFSQRMANAQQSCPIAYITGHRLKENTPLFPLWVHAPLTVQNIAPDLEQMAFNTHLCWKPSMNLDIAKEFAAFCADDNNYHASISFALSVQTKLASVGIQGNSPLQAAEAFAEKLEREPEIFKTLCWLEHRRWVLEKACAGWLPRQDLADCLKTGSVQDKRDKAHKKHPCMLFSTPENPLESWTSFQWDTPGTYDAALDPLDAMSVNLHRLFAKDAARVLQEFPIGENKDLAALQTVCCQSAAAGLRQAFLRYSRCLFGLASGVKNAAQQVESYRTALESALCTPEMDDSTRKKALTALSSLQSTYFSLLEARSTRNYKKYDGDLVGNLPFILTYRQPGCIALPLPRQDSSNALFAGVSSLTLLCPSRILYVLEVNSRTEILPIEERLQKLQRYLQARSIACVPELLLLQNGDCFSLVQALSDRLEANGIACTLQTGAAPDLAAQALSGEGELLWDGSQPLYTSPLENASWIAALRKEGIPYFEFDSVHKRFTAWEGCEFLRYFRRDDKTFLRITDLFALNGCTPSHYGPPAFDEQGAQTLWKIFNGERTAERPWYAMGNWNILCNKLKEQEAKRPFISLCRTDSAMNHRVETSLPQYLYTPAQNFLKALIEANLADGTSCMKSVPGGVCRLTLLTAPENAAPLQKFLPTLARHLQPQYHLRVALQPTPSVQWDELTVQNLSLEDPAVDQPGMGERLYKILRALEENGYLLLLSPLADGKVSFAYPSCQVRDLLTQAGQILELYSYYSALSTNYFDDFTTGCAFTWMKDGVSNELDLVLTKGFCTVLAECKSLKQLSMDSMHKLDSLAGHFGVNCTKVLIGNTYYNREDYNAANELQRSRGSQMGIENIYRKEDLEAVGEKLKDLMENASR